LEILTESYETKQALTIQLRNCTLGHLSQIKRKFCSHNNQWTNIHSSFIPSSSKLEALVSFFGRRDTNSGATMRRNTNLAIKAVNYWHLTFPATWMTLQRRMRKKIPDWVKKPISKVKERKKKKTQSQKVTSYKIPFLQHSQKD
jgi:hypothetical protein